MQPVNSKNIALIKYFVRESIQRTLSPSDDEASEMHIATCMWRPFILRHSACAPAKRCACPQGKGGWPPTLTREWYARWGAYRLAARLSGVSPSGATQRRLGSRKTLG